MPYQPITRINTIATMRSTLCGDTKATVCTPNGFAMSARCARLRRMLKANLK